MSVNADLDPTGTGFDWGSDPLWTITVDNGPGFQGTWTGRFVGTFVNGLAFDFEAIGRGTGDFDGLVYLAIGTREVPGDLATVDVYITNPDPNSPLHIPPH